MSSKKRKREVFEIKAGLFSKAVEHGQGFEEVVRDGRSVLVGKGTFRGLISKSNRIKAHLPWAKLQEKRLVEFLRREHIVPKHFVLVQIPAEPGVLVQKYFNRPTVQALLAFFRIRRGERPVIPLGKEDRLLCRQFLRKNKKLTFEKLEEGCDELGQYVARIGDVGQADSNFIVVYQTRDGRPGLAIADV